MSNSIMMELRYKALTRNFIKRHANGQQYGINLLASVESLMNNKTIYAFTHEDT